MYRRSLQLAPRDDSFSESASSSSFSYSHCDEDNNEDYYDNEQTREDRSQMVDLQRYLDAQGIDVIVEEHINGGSFGTVYSGMFQGQKVAIKIERSGDHVVSSLKTEFDMYKRIHEQQLYEGIPKCLFFHAAAAAAATTTRATAAPGYDILILPLMGKNLKDIMETCPGKKFSLYTTLMIAVQVLSHLKFIHERGVVSRDVKPQNLLVGSNTGFRQSMIYFLDFGLSKIVWNPATGKHIPPHQYPSITGTLRYLGPHAHERQEASRRDDLQSMMYMLIYFLKGSLPWQDIVAEPQRPGEPEERARLVQYEQVYQMKMRTKSADLCQGLPPLFPEILDYTLGLKFEQRPDYGFMEEQFWKALQTVSNNKGIQYHMFDWVSNCSFLGHDKRMNQRIDDDDNREVEECSVGSSDVYSDDSYYNPLPRKQRVFNVATRKLVGMSDVREMRRSMSRFYAPPTSSVHGSEHTS